MKTVRALPLGVVAAFAALLLSPLLMAVPTEIARESFEGAGGAIGFTTSVAQFDEPTVATSDFFSVIPNNGTKLSGGTISGGDGASMFAAEDIDTAPALVSPTQFITFNPVNITGKTNTSVKLLLAAPGNGPAGGGTQNFYDHSATAADIDFVRVEASVGGGPFNPILQFSPTNPQPALNSPLSRDTDFDGLGGQGTTLTAAFQEFDVPFSTGASVQIRVTMHSNATSEYICIDNVRIFGDSPATSPPVLAGVPGTALIFPEGGPATAIAPAITVTDSDSANLSSATVTISSNFTSGQDVLAATPSGAILAGDIVYNAGTGTLTITRSAPLATYQIVLRSVSYQNTNATAPNVATRSVTFSASDGSNPSNSPIRQVQVTDLITTQNLPFTETFETDGRGTRYALDGRFTNGTAMFDRGTPSGITNADGSFAILAEDTLLDAAAIKAVAFQLNTASFGSVNASVRLGALGGAIYDTGDTIAIEASVNGAAFTTIAAFRSMGGVSFPLALDTDGNGVGDGTQLSTAMQDFSFAMPAATTLGLRVRCQSNSAGERLIVDRIVVTGLAKPVVSTPVPDVTVNEDAANGTVNLRSYFSDLEDGAAGLTYTVQTNTNTGLVSTSINNSTDVLTLDYADNASGTANITIRATDTAAFFVEDTFLVTVNAVNDKPSFTAFAATQTNEDAGPQSVSSFAGSFNPGPASETSQTVLAYAVSGISAPTLFSSPPAVAANGTLTYTPAANANGVASFQLRVQDNGGTANGGIDLSDAQTVTITINAVNDKPSFTAAAPPPVNEDAGAQTMNNFITGFSGGPSDESASQSALGYVVSAVSNPSLFASAPAITGNSLFYTPSPNANGSSTFEVRVTDNGGTANGGVAVSDPQVFTITVNSVNDLPSITGQNTVSIGEGSSRAIAFADLLVTDSDNAYPTGFTLTVSNGSNYTRAGNTVTPIPGFAGTLSVPVKVNDGSADSNTLNLVVTVNPSSEHIRNSVRAVRQPNGTCNISFVGVPGETYSVQSSDTLLAGSWHFLASATAGPDANASLVDLTSPGIPNRYYRVLLPYQNDFNTGLGAATVRGTAAWEAGALRLTDETGNLVNAVIFDGLPATPDLTGFRARFNLSIGPAENPDPADGVSFAVGNLGATGWGESGPATASNLSIGFDTYNNGTINVNRGIHVWVNGSHRAFNPTFPFTFGESVPVEIVYDVTAGLTVKFQGVTIFNNIATTGFVFPANGNFGIGARTGGSVERAVIDDVEILPR